MEKASKQVSYIQGINGDNEGAQQSYEQKHKTNLNTGDF